MKPVDRRAQEHTQPTPSPLMTQNGGTGMMMQQTPMYPAGYQMPPSVGYPTAPATPSGIPSGAAPPPTMMYPNAPPTPMMQPVYSHGYASGSSTPVHPNARSPARSRKAMGIDNASSWLGQQHPHLGGPGTAPGSPYASRAPSVMSMMSTMTGFNDDAVSVMSAGGANLVELQPATSHQTENIDPARMGVMLEEVKNLALRISQQPPEQAIQAVTTLAELLSRSHPERFPKEVLNLVIEKTLEALYGISRLQQDQMRMSDMLGKLFFILHTLACTSYQTRESICAIAQQHRVFDFVMTITFQAMSVTGRGGGQMFMRSLGFLTQLIRDEHRSQYSKAIIAHLANNKELFSMILRQTINTQYPTAIEFVCRMLMFGDRKKFREKITELKVSMLLGGNDTHPGVLIRYIRKGQGTEIHNILKIIEMLIRNDPNPTQHEIDIQNWFINQNVFLFLKLIIERNSNVPKLVYTSLLIYATLAGSLHIKDNTASEIALTMVSDQCLRLTELKLQNMIIFTLSSLSAKRIELQRILMDTQAFNYACHLIKSYGNQGNIVEAARLGLLEEALNVCLKQLQLTISPEQSQQLWTEGGEKNGLTLLFFEEPFVKCLLNVLVSGSMSELLKTKAVQVMVEGLSLPNNRFAPILFSTFDEIKRENVVSAVFHSVGTIMLSGTPTGSGAAFLRAVADLLVFIVNDPTVSPSLIAYAKSNSTHFPLNILFCPVFENEERIAKKLLLVCKELITKDPEVQQLWGQYREQFNNLSVCGNYEIAPLATDILGFLGSEGQTDFDITMNFANAFS